METVSGSEDLGSVERTACPMVSSQSRLCGATIKPAKLDSLPHNPSPNPANYVEKTTKLIPFNQKLHRH